ncbi:MAG TPA: CYTH domain-containing protein [Gammaproteobacteria bacterium]|nr:CYTH domain-containing protein [Gammaproteobacteria bacterium]
MATEIERKFTVKNAHWRSQVDKSERYVQGYLAGNERTSVRIRIAGDKANINIKSATLGIFRQEYEYPIPLNDAEKMLADLCEKPLIDKVRHWVTFAGKTWEIDEFKGENEGLIVAEIELNDIEESFELPDWADKDVSHDKRYYNVSLVNHPFKDW